MPDNPTDPPTQRAVDLDAGWGELLDGIGHSRPVEVAAQPNDADAQPQPVDEQDPRELDVAQKRSANEMLAQMARMLDVGEGTGPLVDLRRVLAPAVAPPTPASAPAVAPLIPAREEVVDDAPSEVETPRVVERAPASERTVVTKRPRDDAPLLLELGDEAPEPVDVRDDAPRLLAISDPAPRPIEGGEESWPRTETRRSATRNGESSAAHPRTVDTSPRPAVPRAARSQWPWIAGAAALVIALGWAVMRPSPSADDADVAQSNAAPQRSATRPTDAAAAAAIADPRARETARVAAPEPAKTPAPPPEPAAKPTPPPPEPAAKPEPTPQVEPTPPPPTTPTKVAAPEPAKPPAKAEAPAIEGTPAELLTAADAALGEQRFEDAHALASRAWADGHDNAAVRVMAIAGCELQDGALARSAFRKLKGPAIRSEVYTLCRGRSVDVRANVDGYTPPELLVKARRELDKGEHQRAYELARSSNKAAHTSAAMQLMAIAACHLHDADEAAQLITMVSRDRKPEVIEACKSAGNELPAE